jgi:hypothetical protein
MRVGKRLIAVVLGFLFLLASAAYSYEYIDKTSNLQGEISYSMRAYGLPLQYAYSELHCSCSTGASSYIKLSPGLLVADLIFWSVVGYALLYLLEKRRAASTLQVSGG